MKTENTPRFQPADYAKSAAIYGHSCGPFEFNGYRYVRNASGNNVCQLGDVGATVTSEQENSANGNLFEQAPDTLIERDHLRDTVLPKCVEAMTALDLAYLGGAVGQHTLFREMRALRAALALAKESANV